jgi:hypothetical protein
MKLSFGRKVFGQFLFKNNRFRPKITDKNYLTVIEAVLGFKCTKKHRIFEIYI